MKPIMEKQAPRKKNAVARICCVCLLFGIAISNMAVSLFFWRTNILGDYLLESLELNNGSQSFEWWEQPPVRSLYKIRVFNYTNVDRFNSGEDSKLTVQETGNYEYSETLTRENVEVHENGTLLSYQERRTYEYVGGSPENETIVIPNIPMMTLVAMVRDTGYLIETMVWYALCSLKDKPFIKITAAEYLWGYDSSIYEVAKNVPMISLPSEKFGLLAAKVGLSKDRYTIYSGTGDLDKLGIIHSINGMKSQNVWGDEECDKIQGTDGTRFPPKLFQDRNATLHVYVKDMCRSIPFQYIGNASALGIPTLRYQSPPDVYTSSQTKNACFCNKEPYHSSLSKKSCPPPGIFNSSSCGIKAPILLSNPHFYLGVESLRADINGLNPQKELHDTYIDLHPRLGIPIGGLSRFQINLEVRKAKWIPIDDQLKDGSILPLIWVEIGPGDVPKSAMESVHEAYYTIAYFEILFTWGTLIVAVFATIGAIVILNKVQRDQS